MDYRGKLTLELPKLHKKLGKSYVNLGLSSDEPWFLLVQTTRSLTTSKDL